MKIGFNNLTCELPIKENGIRTPDHIRLIFAIDTGPPPFFGPKAIKEWPLNLPFIKMDKNDRAPVAMAFEFEESLQVAIWNAHMGSSNPNDYELIGSYTFKSEDTGAGNIDFTGYDSLYNLEYKYFDTEQIPYVRLLGVKCIKPASSIDQAVITSIMNTASGVATVFADSLKDVPDPRAKAASVALNAAAVVFEEVPEIAKAIAEAGNDHDQLYLTIGLNGNPEYKIFPSSEYVLSNVESEFDLYEFDKNLEFPLVGTTSFSLWEKDSASPNDWLGQITIHTTDEVGFHMQTTFSSAEGSIYLVSYEILLKEII